MATDKLRNQMDGFMQPASDQAPTMGLYDTNTPQSVREGTPLRLFDKSRARYKKGDVVEEDCSFFQQQSIKQEEREDHT